MQEPAAPQNQQQAGIRTDDVNAIDAFLGHGAIGRNDYCIYPTQEFPQSIGPENGNNNQVVVVPPLVAADHEEAPNEELQQDEQADLLAVCNILELGSLRKNVITARHVWQVLKKLRKRSYRLISPREAAYYARILARLARVIAVPVQQDYEAAHLDPHHPLGFEATLQILQERAPDDESFPFDYDECLQRLCGEMTAAFSLMRGADGVFVLRDRDEFADRLRSLAARLLRAV